MELLSGVSIEGPRETRTGRIPERGKNDRKYLTRSIWLNNNKLTTTKDMDVLVDSVLEQPEKLGWIDFSFNNITTIDAASILKYPNLKIVYFHGNQITDIEEVFKLRNLKQLRSVTFHGNPISERPQYRAYVIAVLPQVVIFFFCFTCSTGCRYYLILHFYCFLQIVNLDFTPVLCEERKRAMPPDALKKIQQMQQQKVA